MKTRLIKWIALLGTVALLVSSLSMVASAAGSNDDGVTVADGKLFVNGEALTASKRTIACGGGSAAFDPDTHTLTLNNAEMSKGKDRYVIASGLPELTIVFVGKTVCNCSYNAEYFLYAKGNVTFTGSGSLDMMSEEYMELEDGNYGYADVKSPAFLKIKGDLVIDHANLDYLHTALDTSAIVPMDGNITVTDSTLTHSEIGAKGTFTIERSTIRGEQYQGDIYYVDDRNRTQLMEDAIAYRRSVLQAARLTAHDSNLLQTTVKNVSNTSATVTLNGGHLDYSTVRIDGALTLQNVTATCADRAEDARYAFRKCQFFANTLRAIDCALVYSECVDVSAELIRTTLTDSSLQSEGDVVMEQSTLVGVPLTVDGSLSCTGCTVDAEQEGQNSVITCQGERVDLIDCDFKGIAETRQGSRQVYLGNGIPATQTYDYYTFSGASLCVYRTGESEPVVNLTNSRLLMDQIRLDCVLNVNETRLQLCTSNVDQDKVTISGNIAIVTGAWNADRESGLFIDYLGDYFTFDEQKGELHLNNAYGVRGWEQRVDIGYSGGEFIRDAETVGKVKKVVIGKDVTYGEYRDWFSGYTNLKEIDFGNGVEQIGVGVPNYVFRNCSSLETITVGSNVTEMPGYGSSGMPLFRDCVSLKTLTIKTEKLSDYRFSSLQFDWFGNLYLPELTIYVPVSQVERFQAALPAYKDQIVGVDFSSEALLCDLDGNGTVNMADAFMLFRAVSGQTVLTDAQEAVADMDDNGTINMADAFALYRMVAGG
ncbi:MAG: leucine-rich repeat protein [Clostridia bacterium]|nr:leucine-rich repeat protein [Clostridia bacterium]